MQIILQIKKDWKVEFGIDINLFQLICRSIEIKYNWTKAEQIRSQFNLFDRKHKGFITNEDFKEVRLLFVCFVIFIYFVTLI